MKDNASVAEFKKKKKNLIHEVIHELLKVVYVMQLMFSFITCFI